MSTAGDRQRAAQVRRLEAALAKPENRECFDCAALRPRWASTNLGIFVCMRCAGIHRSLGTHISKVKSINMDNWDEDMIQNCEKIGNGEGKFLYEANLPSSFVKPKMNADNVEVERVIRNKFELKMYYPRPEQHLHKAHHSVMHAAAAAGAPIQAQVVAAVPAQSHTVPVGVVQAVSAAAAPALAATATTTAAANKGPDLFAAFAESRQQQTAPAVPQPPPQQQPQPAATGLDFFGSGATASPPQQQQQQQHQQQFYTAPPGQQQQFYTAPAAVQQQQQQQQQPPVDFFGAPVQGHAMPLHQPVYASNHSEPLFFGAPQTSHAPPQQHQQQHRPHDDFFGPSVTNHATSHGHHPSSVSSSSSVHHGGHDAFNSHQSPHPHHHHHHQQQGFHSMYQPQSSQPVQAAAPVHDPFSALARDRPKTPPHHHSAPAAAQPQYSMYQQAAPAPAAAPAPKRSTLDDLFA